MAVLKRHRSLVRAEPEARRTLETLPQLARVEPGKDAVRGDADGEEVASSGVDYGALHYVLSRIWERAELESRGADMLVKFPEGARVWIRKRILEAAGLLKEE